MKTVPETFEIESLLAESEWVGGLALSLVGDSHAAEDLAQDVWLAALRRAPARRDSARPWLATVARNAARMLRRSDGARRGREEARAREAALSVGASPEDLALRLESHELVLGLVRGLPEDLADVISLAFFEGLSSDEIAQRRGLKPATVRQRKKRALDALRERLDTHYGGERSAWMSALAPLAVTWSRRGAKAAAAGGTLTATLTPWLGMALTWKSASLLLALFLAVAAFVVGGDDAPTLAPDSPDASTASLAEVPPDAPVAALAVGHPSDAERTLVPAASPPAALAAAPITRVTLRVVDEGGEPVAGATVRAVPSAALGTALRDAVAGLDSAKLLLLEASLVSMTDGMGEVSWETDFLSATGSVGFEALSPHFEKGALSAVIEAGSDVDLGDLVLHAGGIVEGFVRMSGGEEPGRKIVELGPAVLPKSAGGLARLREFGLRDAVDMDTTDTRGSFRFEGVPPGEYRAYVGPLGSRAQGWSEPFSLGAGDRIEGLELVLNSAAPAPAEVLVLDATGAPLAHAEVELRVGESRYTGQVNAKGLWNFNAISSSFRGGSLVVRDGSLLHKLARVDPLPSEPGRIVVRMERAATAEHALDLVDTAGQVVTRARVVVAGVAGERIVGDFESGAALRLPAASEGPFDLTVAAAGFRKLEMKALGVDSLPDPWRLTLEPLPGIHGRVLAEGEPLARAKVHLSWRAAEGRVIKDGNSTSELVGAFGEARTGDDGMFALAADEDSDLVLSVSRSGYADAVVELSGYRASDGASGLVVEMDRGGEVEGVVRDHTGAVVPRASVVLNHPLFGLLEKTAKSDGSFRFKRVPSGNWYLRVVPNLDPGYMTFSFETPEDWTYPENCAVVAGGTTTHDLVLEDPASSSISGRLTVTGTDPGAMTLEVEDGAGGLFQGDPFASKFNETFVLGSDGAFEVRLPAGHDYDLALSSPELGGALRSSVSKEELPLELEGKIAFASLDLQVAAWLGVGAGNDWVSLTWTDGTWTYTQRLMPDSKGHLDQVILPAGSVEVEWRAAPGAAFEELTLELEPGEERVVELP